MSVDARNNSASLKRPVQYLKGVGPRLAELLERLGLQTARDLLFFFPRDYRDMSQVCRIDQFREGEAASVIGTVTEVELRGTGPGRSVLGVLFQQDRLSLRGTWFNQPFMQHRFARGDRMLVSGEPRYRGMRWEMVHPRVEPLTEEDASKEDATFGCILPVYRLTDGVSQAKMRAIAKGAAGEYAGLIEEVFPTDFLEAHALLPIDVAIRMIHCPESREWLERAQRRLVFQELLVMQLALSLRKSQTRIAKNALPLPLRDRIDARIVRLFPFPLTADQRRAVDEIAADMGREIPMNRLLQGDVGCGKTMVAQYAMLLCAAHQAQAVLMAPTEILARQHAAGFRSTLRGSRLRIGLLTGSLRVAERRELLEHIASGQIDLVVGTHAVLNDSVRFAKLGLVVIDEQHKFGVEQRARLRRAGVEPHYLVMTATPIPRTAAMTVFGDLDVSTIRQLPPGRQPVHTYVGEDAQRSKWWEFFRKKLREGRQGYVVAPVVEESETSDLVSVSLAFEELANGELEEFRTDLVHGGQPSEEKEAALEAFRSGKTQVLVATSVVEVGIDVPNATLMTIENGERFGLAQLHQLRGRISRGRHPGYLCLFAANCSAEVEQRLRAFADTNDGFELAELDYQLRGPGELFGIRQFGLPSLRIADLRRDTELLQEAREVACALTEHDPEFTSPPFARLRKMVLARFGKALELGHVG